MISADVVKTIVNVTAVCDICGKKENLGEIVMEDRESVCEFAKKRGWDYIHVGTIKIVLCSRCFSYRNMAVTFVKKCVEK